MIDKKKAPEMDKGTQRKRAYAAPRIVEFGSVRDITGAGTGSVVEGGTMASTKKP